MEPIIIDLSGRNGLIEGFFGDKDTVTPQYNTRLDTGQGQMAGGMWSSYLRDGYMAPPVKTTTDLTPSTNYYTASVYDPVSNKTYYAEKGTNIFSTSDLTTTTLVDTGIDSLYDVQDLEIYSKNGVRTLYFTSLTDETYTIINSVNQYWQSAYVRVPASGSVKPYVVGKEAKSAQSTSVFDGSITEAQSGDILIFITRSTGDVTGDINGVALTEVAVDNDTFRGSDNNINVLVGTFAASQAVNIDSTTSDNHYGYVVVRGGTSSVTASLVAGITNELRDGLTYDEDSLYVNYVYAQRISSLVSSIAPGNTKDISTETDNLGSGLAWNNDGTKFFTVGFRTVDSTWNVFEYTSSSYNILSLTHSGTRLDLSVIEPRDVSLHFNDDGTKLIIKNLTDFTYRTLTLTTGFDLSSYTSFTSQTIAGLPSTATYRGTDITEDGTKLYIAYRDSKVEKNFIAQYNLGTAWDLSTATLSGTYEVEGYPTQTIFAISLHNDDKLLIINVNSGSNTLLANYKFDIGSPGDITKLSRVTAGAGFDVGSVAFDCRQITPRVETGEYFVRNLNTGILIDLNTSFQAISLPFTQNTIASDDLQFTSSRLMLPDNKRLVECGTSEVFGSTTDDDWLTSTQNEFIVSGSDYNFLRLAENGFMYLFAGHTVNKIDGETTGGIDGNVTKNVLLFPEEFTITDAVNFRSVMYIALQKYPVNFTASDTNYFQGGCGIYIWDMVSTQFGRREFIEIPGVKRIVKLYPSQDGMVKLLTVNDEGLSELRQFGYNDAGGVVFRLVKTLGLGGAPSTAEGLTLVGDKAIWLGSNGKLYSERENNVSILTQLKQSGATTATTLGAITTGTVLYGGSSQSGDSGFREDKTYVTVSYLNGVNNELKRIYAFDVKGHNNTTQTVYQGDVYTPVYYVPIGSNIRKLRIYNLPTVSTGETAVATIKLYYNQSTTPTHPSGMTKTISQKEASRGYVDFNINSPNVNAVQVEVEWPEDSTLNTDTYMPSVMLIEHESTLRDTHDNG